LRYNSDKPELIVPRSKFGLSSAEDKVALANLQANIVSTLQAGCFAGALIAAPIADKFGRKKGLIYTSIVVLIGVIMQFNAWGELAPLYVGRFINGLGVGAASMLVPTYISENVPRGIRGLLTGLYQLFIVTGGMIA
jgi:MFS family permease